jgi:hypothetical protein
MLQEAKVTDDIFLPLCKTRVTEHEASEENQFAVRSIGKECDPDIGI